MIERVTIKEQLFIPGRGLIFLVDDRENIEVGSVILARDKYWEVTAIEGRRHFDKFVGPFGLVVKAHAGPDPVDSTA